MPIPRSQLPDEVLGAFRDGVNSFLKKDNPLRKRLTDARLVGIPTFTLGLDELMNDARPLNVARIGWRLSAVGDDGLVLSADIAEREGQQRMVSLSQDPRAPNLEDLLRQMDNRLADPRQRADISLLRIPGVLVDALIVAPEDGGPATVIPISSPGDFFTPLEPLSVEIFLRRLREPDEDHNMPSLLERFLAFDIVSEEPPPSSSLGA